jgi:hypothetical protein
MAKAQPQAPQGRPDTGLRARLKPYNPDEGHVLQSP